MAHAFGSLREKGYAVQVNFFVEGHGKNPCDSFFSVISRWKSNAESNKRITSVQHLIKKLRKRNQMNREVRGSHEDFQFYEYERTGNYTTKKVFKIKDLKKYYCIQSNDFTQPRQQETTPYVSCKILSDFRIGRKKDVIISTDVVTIDTKRTVPFVEQREPFGSNSIKNIQKQREELAWLRLSL